MVSFQSVLLRVVSRGQYSEFACFISGAKLIPQHISRHFKGPVNKVQ